MSDTLTREQIIEYLKTCPEDEKGRKIVPDDFFDQYYKDLPDGTKNTSKTFMVYYGGLLKIFGGDPEYDRQIQVQGGKALQAQFKRRRTMAEDIEIMLAKYDKSAGMTEQEKGLTAMLKEWQGGNTKAGQFLRDTVGEQPVSKQEINAEIMTDADKAMIQNALNRLKANSPNSSMRADSP